MNSPASPGPQKPAFSIQLRVMNVNPSYGKYTSMSSIQKSLFAFSASTTTCWPWSMQARGLVLLVLGDHAERARRGSAPGGSARSRARSAVVMTKASAPSTGTSMSSRHSGQRIMRAREVVVHRDRVAHGGGRVARGVGAVVDRDVAEVSRDAVLVEVPAGPRRVAHGAAHALGPEAVARPTARAKPHRRNGSLAAERESSGCGRPRGTRARRRTPLCTAPTAFAIAETNGMPGAYQT